MTKRERRWRSGWLERRDTNEKPDRLPNCESYVLLGKNNHRFNGVVSRRSAALPIPGDANCGITATSLSLEAGLVDDANDIGNHFHALGDIDDDTMRR